MALFPTVCSGRAPPGPGPCGCTHKHTFRHICIFTHFVFWFGAYTCRGELSSRRGEDISLLFYGMSDGDEKGIIHIKHILRTALPCLCHSCSADINVRLLLLLLCWCHIRIAGASLQHEMRPAPKHHTSWLSPSLSHQKAIPPQCQGSARGENIHYRKSQDADAEGVFRFGPRTGSRWPLPQGLVVASMDEHVTRC